MSRIRANNITNGAGTGAPTFPHGAIINGISTITANVSLNASKLTVGTGCTINGTTDNTLRFLTNGGERVRITSSGEVGIGTDNPQQLLHLYDDANNLLLLESSDRYADIVQADTGGSTLLRSDQGALQIYTGGDASSDQALNATERISIASGGQIGLNGANYGNDNQVLTSTGNASAPEWRGVNIAFFGRQDSTNNASSGTWALIKNLGGSPINISGWDESEGTFTVQEGQAGTWNFFGSAAIDDVQANDVVRAGISKNGADPTWFVETRADDAASNRIVGGNSVTGIMTAAVGDTFSLRVNHNEGSTEPTEPNRCWFGGFRLSV